MHFVGTQKAPDKWKLVFHLVSSLVSQDTIYTKYEEKILHHLWKGPWYLLGAALKTWLEETRKLFLLLGASRGVDSSGQP